MFLQKRCIVALGMHTRMASAQRLDEEIANEGLPSRGNQDPPLEEVVNDDRALSNPPALSDGDLRVVLLQMAHAISTQAQALTIQAQNMTAQADRMVVPQGNKHVCTMP